MDPITADFERDLDKICEQLQFIETLRNYSAIESLPLPIEDDIFIIASKGVHALAQKTHGNIPLVSGTLILYTCGRFEAMSRTLFEDFCQRLVMQAGTFARLPKRMRENLPVFTAKVISEPRKYGHAENGVRAFVSNLASNLEPGAKVSSVNHECLSITDSNLKPDALAELFGRVGGSRFWEQISDQASMKTYFKESDSAKVVPLCRRKLEDLMELRNRIAHPSGEFEWPSIDGIRDYVDYLRILSRAMSDLVGVYAVTLCSPVAQDIAKS